MTLRLEPTIYYLGNKLRTAEAIDDICARRFGRHATVLDAFAGSASVSRQFAKHRRVISNDIQAFSQVICRALLAPEASSGRTIRSLIVSERLRTLTSDLKERFQDAIDAERRLTRESSPSALVGYQREVQNLRTQSEFSVPSFYGGLYFSVEQACELEGLRQTAAGLDGPVRFHFLASLISAASRLAFTVGNQFAQPMHWFRRDGIVKETTLQKFIEKRRGKAVELFAQCIELYEKTKNYSNSNICLRNTAEGSISEFGGEVDFIYCDPPYGREHYSRYYHVLETLALLDHPEIVNNTTMMRGGRFQSQYSIRSKSEKAFRTLFETAGSKNLPLALSYADDTAGDKVANRVMSVSHIVSIATEYYSDIETIRVHNRPYAQMNSDVFSSKKRANTEVLIVARN